jgi:pimeloyl-ACP methyl ester carboxylesterase
MWMFGRVLLGLLVVLIIAVTIGPLLIPVPPLTGLAPPEQLADPDSRFIEVDGLTVHYKVAGRGAPLILLLHGFGANTESWRRVMAPLAQHGTVVAYDRPGFGLTERPLDAALAGWPGDNPYGPDAQVELAVGLMRALGFEPALLVGNSAGGTVAMHTYLRYPERVAGIAFVDAAIYTGGQTPGWLRPLLGTPQATRLGILISRNILAQGDDLIRLAWHDPAKITAEDLALYRRPTRVEGWDRALWEFTRAGRALQLGERVADVRLPVLVITGDDDRIVPTADSVRLARELPQAGLVVIPSCGHVPQEECPEAFLDALRPFVDQFKQR